MNAAQPAQPFGHVYRVVAGTESAKRPWAEGEGNVFVVGPASRDGVCGNIQYVNLYTAPQPRAVPADLADWMRAIYAKMPPFPITPETCDAATDALHEFCLVLGVYNIGPDDLAAPTPEQR